MIIKSAVPHQRVYRLMCDEMFRSGVLEQVKREMVGRHEGMDDPKWKHKFSARVYGFLYDFEISYETEDDDDTEQRVYIRDTVCIDVFVNVNTKGLNDKPITVDYWLGGIEARTTDYCAWLYLPQDIDTSLAYSEEDYAK